MKKKDKTPLALRLVRWFFPKLEWAAPALAARYFRTIFFTPLNYRLPEKERPFLESAKKFSMMENGKHIQGYTWGEGQPVLLVHGWAGRATQFRSFIQALNNAGFKAVSFDGPAHGLSGGRRTNIIEFSNVIKQAFTYIGQPMPIIAHSFGGVASMYSAVSGLPLTTLITIASPSIGDEVIWTYLRAINGSWKTGAAFKTHVESTYGKTFDEWSSLHFVKHLQLPLALLIVQDADDKEVIMRHATELKKAYPPAQLLQTTGLGHTRILRDEEVIRTSLRFIRDRQYFEVENAPGRAAL